jgi:hypothetical protein
LRLGDSRSNPLFNKQEPEVSRSPEWRPFVFQQKFAKPLHGLTPGRPCGGVDGRTVEGFVDG